jgi:hypothetical protein
MMKRRVGTTSHTGIWITKDASSELICLLGLDCSGGGGVGASNVGPY